ncbi:gtp-binding protein gtr1 [Diaporthe amygdali]|uniref:gtp-binding protein gtr1 n=1 Tax=Phomopsis amygdali TaxID=1214568 RepID=UPI0022FE2739|nr:gtp-binding protein gtr1 [Diaporthe amygdali]KAJ0116980.1 gtp-binding protein gtr1 [Diaporthe amygdali]
MDSNSRLEFPTLVEGVNPLTSRLHQEEEQQQQQKTSSPSPSSSSSSSTLAPSVASSEAIFPFEMDAPAPAEMGSAVAPAVAAGSSLSAPSEQLKKAKKRKVLLMGKSGSGKSSMRSIIFSNYLAVDTRRLGATIDVDLSHVKFLGNLTLNLWDCGGQEAFMENYINQQRAHVFSHVGVLIYVFDIESRDVDRDLATYVSIVSALAQYSPAAKVFVLVHKMDLIMPNMKESVFNERVRLVRNKTTEALQNIAGLVGPARVDIQPFATSIWDQSLYKAWSSIIHDLIPNLAVIEKELGALGQAIEAEEIFLYERTSFLVVSTWKSEEAQRNPHKDREERLSNVMKTFKNRLAGWSGTSRNSDQFKEFQLNLGTLFSFVIMTFTTNTYIQLVLPPGEARLNAAKLNTRIAASHFERLDAPPAKDAKGSGAGSAKGSDSKGLSATMSGLDISGDEQGHAQGDGDFHAQPGGPSTAPAA